MNNITLFTIGYSDLKIDEFISILKKHRIDAIADVRSSPFSKYNPEFNINDLKKSLKNNGIKYVFLGEELGARRSEVECYRYGKVSYGLVPKTQSFKKGIKRLLTGIEEMRVSLMCAEKDPINCHRFVLICLHLRTQIDEIKHIINGEIEDNVLTEKRLLSKYKLVNLELFRPDSEILEEAYNRQAEKISYVDDQDNNLGQNNETSLHDRFHQKTAKEFFAKLKTASVKRILDIRLNNRSQLAGFAKKDDLEYFLLQINNIKYAHLVELSPTKEILDSFKNKKIDWDEYERQFNKLMKTRKIELLMSNELNDGDCFLCSEDKPQHCHRRLVAEYLKNILGNIKITHL